MPRHLFGGSPSDYAMERVATQLLLRPESVGTVWDSLVGGTQITDLTDLAGNPMSTVTADTDGAVTFFGPNDVTSLYVDFGYGRRYVMAATDTGAALASFIAQGGVPGGWATLDDFGKIPATQISTQIDWYNARSYGALGDGTTDDRAALQAAIDAAAAAGGGTVYLPYGVYRISNTLTLKSKVTLRGAHSTAWVNRFPTSLCAIKPTSAFAGECIISMLGADITGASGNEGNVRIFDLELDGSALPAGSVSGIHAQGEVLDVVLARVLIKQCTHNGIHTNVGTGTKAPHDWYLDSVVCYQNAQYGFSMSMTDGYFRNCIATTNSQDGWFVGPFGSLTFEGCQALWNTQNGLTVAGGTQVGNITITNFLTDRNGWDGIHLGSSSGSGSPPIVLTGIALNRDGRNNKTGGGGYAGLRIDALANPVIINGLTVNTGVDDDATGTNSPQYGIRLTGANAYVQVNGGYVHGNTTGWSDDGATVVLRRFNVDEATGSKTSPTFVYGTGVATHGTSLDVPGHTVGIASPREHGAIAWTVDPRYVRADKLLVAGTLYLAALYVPRPATATKLGWGINVAASGVTAGQNFVGLYNSAGTRLASVGVDGRLTAIGPNSETISVSLTPGLYWVAYLFNATTMPRLYVGGDLSGSLLNWNVTGASLAFATNGTGLTALPASITPSSNAVSQACLFGAVA